MPAALSIESEARVQAALAASARADASLNGLFRTIQHLGTGVGGAREANESLIVELEGLRELLGGASLRQVTFEQKLTELERVLDRTRKEHAAERTFLIDQQDAFLLKLLDEQEAELKRRDSDLEVLRGRVAELERRQPVTLPPSVATSVQIIDGQRSAEWPGSELARAERAELERTAQKLAEDRERARETVARLQVQRDDAQTAVARISKERDEALQQIHRLRSELGGPRVPASTLPPPPEERLDSSAEARVNGGAGSAFDQVRMEARLDRPRLPTPHGATPASPTWSAERGGSPPISSILQPPPSDPNAAPLTSRLTPAPGRPSAQPVKPSPPPEELRRALTGAPMLGAGTPPSQPLKQKPDASTRPLVGYSMGTESVETEHLDGIRTSSKPSPPGSGQR